MEELPGKIIKGLLLTGLLCAVGASVGVWLGAVWLGLALGVTAAVVWLISGEAVRGARLMRWLRDPQGGEAPRDPGFWGEVAYRVEKSLRQRDLLLTQERGRLQEFLSAIEASPNGVLLLDRGDQIDWLNSKAAQHFGLNPQRDRLQRITNLVRMPSFVSYLQDGEFEEPVVFSGPGGRSTLSVLIRPYGEGMKLVLSQDVTEIERANAMRRDFVANVSHEIRTPLTVLSGFVETMASLPLSEAERARVLSLMAQQTERMQTLVGDLLTLAQLEGSPLPSAEQWLDVQRLLQRALADAQALSGGRHRFECKAVEGVQIAASETELQSAIANLLTNAVRYTPAGGKIGIAWHWRADGGGNLEVVDDGIGVAREHIPRLTERFYRVDGSRSRETGGTGLGLSIVKHVMQRHGGEIDVQSEPGKGSVFRLRLPALRVRQLPLQGADSSGASVTAALSQKPAPLSANATPLPGPAAALPGMPEDERGREALFASEQRQRDRAEFSRL